MISLVVRHLASPTFVGRQEQLEALLGLARSAEPAVALIGGEAGVGKTRLVEEFAKRAEAEGTLCLVGGCLAFGDQALPLAPAAAILRGLAERADVATLGRVLGRASGELSRLVPELADGVLESTEPLPSARLFELFLGVVHRLAAERRLVLVFEDLHWADTSSRDLFGFIARLMRAPVLLAGTYRSDELHRRHPLLPLLSELRRAAHPEDITLEPLRPQDVAELVAGLTGRPAAQERSAEIYRRSGGNPFYVEELAAHPGDVTGAVPDALRDVILSRATPLGEDAFHLLCAAAAAGGVDDMTIVSSVAGLSAEAGEGLLPDMVASGLLVACPSGWRFRHELAREVFEDQLLPGERAGVHAGLADRLLADRPDQPERISYHLWRAGDRARALEWSIKAARAAEELGASAEAQADYERALDVWDQAPDAAERAGMTHAGLRLAAADAARRAGRHGRAIEHIWRAIEELSSEPAAEGSAWLRLAPALWMAGQPGVQEAMVHALELIPAEPPSADRASALAWSGLIHLWQGQFREASSVSRDALEMASVLCETDLGSQRAEIWARNIYASTKGSLGDRAAPDLLRQVLDRARKVGDTDDIARAYVNLTHTLGQHGRHDEALAVATEGERVLADLGDRFGSGLLVTLNKLDALFRLGDWGDLEAAAIELEQVADLSLDSSFAVSNYARMLLRRGRMTEAREAFRDHARLLSDGTNQPLRGPVMVSLVELAVHDRSWSEARGLVERALPALLHSFPLDAAELVSAGIAAEAERVSVRPDPERADAHAVAERWLGQLHEAVEPFLGSAFDEQLDAWLAQAAAELRRLERNPAADQWTQVATAWRQQGRPYEEGYALLRAAEAVLIEAGVADVDQRARATDLLSRAQQQADELDATLLSDAAGRLARQARLSLDTGASDTSPATAERPFGLTDREIQVLELLAEGKTNGEIGAALFVSRKTASVHVSNILRKLGAANRVEAATIAYRSGLFHEA